jgi:hypothetical protein
MLSRQETLGTVPIIRKQPSTISTHGIPLENEEAEIARGSPLSLHTLNDRRTQLIEKKHEKMRLIYFFVFETRSF